MILASPDLKLNGGAPSIWSPFRHKFVVIRGIKNVKKMPDRELSLVQKKVREVTTCSHLTEILLVRVPLTILAKSKHLSSEPSCKFIVCNYEFPFRDAFVQTTKRRSTQLSP